MSANPESRGLSSDFRAPRRACRTVGEKEFHLSPDQIIESAPKNLGSLQGEGFSWSLT
jgi:hypothetical protein